ncbi:unnamed protein product [Vitrella brassicaformis CCMP3155]|uniref:Uncharacterized protein n=1 Tax=Vitrella brassicaformis (strain CCMP3155) TaxID=1169540 RepID=A0A0G4FKJ5_VITBC|nr:unnamed protein product [Vitrella brassicaformis CCMP3155]|mmetsp:Transcript_21887/g.53629  ORF Transcript_21887/g.53629 Transcript_21887/m.53629 type:complete len:99 (+) Transcript_21887:280-576(+)|eukprot:CEM14110.1 unnamed protein product [Vitrella brassicaformis CCMP3155]
MAAFNCICEFLNAINGQITAAAAANFDMVTDVATDATIEPLPTQGDTAAVMTPGTVLLTVLLIAYLVLTFQRGGSGGGKPSGGGRGTPPPGPSPDPIF